VLVVATHWLNAERAGDQLAHRFAGDQCPHVLLELGRSGRACDAGETRPQGLVTGFPGDQAAHLCVATANRAMSDHSSRSATHDA